MTAMSFKMPQIGYLLRSHGDAENTCGPKHGESSPVEILTKIGLSERAMFFVGIVVKTVENGLSLAAKRGSKYNDGT